MYVHGRAGLTGNRFRHERRIDIVRERCFPDRALEHEDLIGQSDQVVLKQVLSDFYQMHPVARAAKLTKYTLVRIPNSVYQARPGVDQYRPDQATPVPNLFLAGDYTQQEFMASIEGAVRSAKRAVERIDRAGVRG